MISVRNGIIALMFVLVALVPAGNAKAASLDEMLTQIQALMVQIQALQSQLNTMRGDIKDAIRDGLSEGMTSEDIGKLQEILATDTTIYPEGRVTRFFGPLTKEAVRRFQTRHGLEVTGIVDGETHALLEEYFKERIGGKIPPGLLRAPGIEKKIEVRMKEGCDHSGTGKSLFCEKLKMKHAGDIPHDDKKHEEEDDDEDDDKKHDEEDDDDDSEKGDAKEALEEAGDAIRDAEEAIDDARSDTGSSEVLLEKAEYKLGLAEDAYDAGKYADAETYAEYAEDYADDAVDALD